MDYNRNSSTVNTKQRDIKIITNNATAKLLSYTLINFQKTLNITYLIEETREVELLTIDSTFVQFSRIMSQLKREEQEQTIHLKNLYSDVFD